MTLLKACPVCGASFEPSGVQRFCSSKCRQSNFYYSFKTSNGFTYHHRPKSPPPRYKLGSRTKLIGGVLRKGGKYLAHISVGNDARQKSYSIAKLGEDGAKLAASLQRMAWMIEMGVWNPKDGDPFEMLSYSESFKRNREYEDAVLDRREISSPWIPEFDKD